MAAAPAGIPRLVVRPSTKFLMMKYLFADLFLIAAIVLHLKFERTNAALAIGVVWVLITIWTAAKHIALRFTTLTVLSDSLRYEVGMVGKTTRSLNLAKVQDVRVEQGLLDRVLAIGDITLETAGESGSLEMTGIDRPQQVADQILEMSRECAKQLPPKA